MQSDNNIDKFIRHKVEAANAVVSNQDAHWQQMKTMLASSGTGVAATGFFAKHLKQLFFAAGIIGVVIFLFFAKNMFTTNKKTTTANTATAITETAAPKNKAEEIVPASDSGLKPGILTVQTNSFNHLTNTYIPITYNFYPCDSSGKLTTANLPDSVKMAYELHQQQELNKAALLNFYQQLEKPIQSFVINTARDTAVICTDGTKLFIPAYIFATADNTIVNGEVTFQVQEFYNYMDIIGNKLTTTSDGEQLISGGMLNLRALQNGKELQLDNIKTVRVQMPTNNFDEQMQLFDGEKKQTSLPIADLNIESGTISYSNTAVNWKPAGQLQRVLRNKFFVQVFDPYGEPYRVIERNDGTTVAKFMVKKNCKMSNENVLKGLKGHFGLFYNKIKLKRSWSNRPRHLFSKEDIPVVGDSISMEYQTAKQLNLVSKADMEKYDRQLFNDSISYSESVKKMPYYEFAISKLGFMNCDRFQNNTSQRVEFTLNLGEDKNAANFVSVIAFEKYRSVLQGYYSGSKIKFSGIPKHDQVYLVSVGAKDGKVVSCVKKMQVGSAEIDDLKFEETSPEDFKKKMAALYFQ